MPYSEFSFKTLEVQIRTWEMNENSEYGIAAYWRYKEGRQRDSDKEFEKRLTYLRRLMEFGPEVQDDPDAFIDIMKTEVFQDLDEGIRVILYFGACLPDRHP